MLNCNILGLVKSSQPLIQHAEDKISQVMETYLQWVDTLKNWLISHGLAEVYVDFIKLIIVFAIILLVALLVNFVTRKIILSIVYHIAKRTRTVLDDILVEKKVFHRLAHLAPAILVYYSITLPLAEFPAILRFMQSVTQIYMVVVGLMVLLAFIDALHEMYLTLPMSKTRSIKGYLQVVKIIIYLIASLFLISILFNQKIIALLAGLGALAAVLMFVFKDTILGLVASIQLSANDMLRPGDWIEMPSRKADGVVQDISLTTVKVQNWDKTITTIPTYTLVSDSFTNWRGMEESEGRRIKKSIYIDMKSVHFYNDKMIEKLEKDRIINSVFDVKKYIEESASSEFSVKDPEHRTITNLGVFRAYIETYLRNIPLIHPEMTLMVHYLQPTENGLPLEIVAFSKEKKGLLFEKLQSDIFDHILATLPVFELRVFQRHTGDVQV